MAAFSISPVHFSVIGGGRRLIHISVDKTPNLSTVFRQVSRRRRPITCITMKAPIISQKTIDHLTSFFSSCSTLNSIRDEFTAVGIECDWDYDPKMSGQRKSLAYQYLETLDLTKRADAENCFSCSRMYCWS